MHSGSFVLMPRAAQPLRVVDIITAAPRALFVSPPPASSSVTTRRTMQRKPSHPIARSCDDKAIFESLLDLNNKAILDIGCGKAKQTRVMATAGAGRRILALEVDRIQHEKNLVRHKDLDNVTFQLAGAEEIPAKDGMFDVVFLFKSLHHVPVNLMDPAFSEIHRVLKPGGLAYISEPIWDGEFCEKLLRLFHDEEEARMLAFAAIQRAIESGMFVLQDEVFFDAPRIYQNWQDFEERTIGVTHTDIQMDKGTLEKVKKEYYKYADPETGAADFYNPMRVDLLQKVE